jgi:import inner membrane translocase subunit TIM54
VELYTSRSLSRFARSAPLRNLPFTIVQPVLVAAAIDYEIIGGKHHGALAEKLALDIKTQRRQNVGLDPPPPGDLMLGSNLRTKESKESRFLQGGTILMGRSTLKEYLAGLHRGYTEGLDWANQEEQLAKQLAEDNVFDEQDLDDSQSSIQQHSTTPTPLAWITTPSKDSDSELTEHLNTPLNHFPPLPPLLLVPFINRIGLKQVPMMILEYFNRRREVRTGGEVALTIIQASTRSFRKEDTDWGKETEGYYKASVRNIPSDIEKARDAYYKGLPKRIAKTRSLERHEREPTKDESHNPPPTEVELRAERLSKESKWRASLNGWELVSPDAEIEWDDRFLSLKVFTDSSSDIN